MYMKQSNPLLWNMSKDRKYRYQKRRNSSDDESFAELDWLVNACRSIFSSNDITKGIEVLKKFRERYNLES